MIPNHNETFEEFLSKSFAEGVYSRELRLSKEEAGYILKKYPGVSLEKSVTTEASDGKCWYEMKLPAPIGITKKSMDPTAILNENKQLKQELERMKRSLSDVGMY